MSDALQFVFYLKDDGVTLLESKNKVSELEISITGLLKVLICFAAPPPPVADEKAVEEEPFELPTLEEVARATGTLQPQPQGTSVDLPLSDRTSRLMPDCIVPVS